MARSAKVVPLRGTLQGNGYSIAHPAEPVCSYTGEVIRGFAIFDNDDSYPKLEL